MLLGILLARLLATPAVPVPQLATVTSGALTCDLFAARDLRNHGWHAFLCLSAAGDLTGAVLRRNGTPVCGITGTVDLATGCYTAAGCGGVADGCP